MHLHFSGAPEITASQDQVWQRLMDPNVVAACIIGVESVEPIDPTHYKVISGFGVGTMKLRFTLDVELYDIVQPTSAKMRARGKAPGSMMDTKTGISLEALAPQLTRLSWEADTDVSGTVASVGARLLEGTARMLTERFWNEFAKRAGE